MSEYGVTERGFVPRTYDEILEDFKAKAREVFGSDVDLSDTSPLLKLLQIYALELHNLWQQLEAVYYSAYLHTASGDSLDDVVALLGFRREPARRATGTVTFSRSTPADRDVVIPKGTRVATSDGSVVFRTTGAVTLAAGETSVDAPVEAEEPGAKGNVAANTITKLIDPVTGIESVNNTEPTSGGRDKETDAALRLRVWRQLAGAGRGTLAAIKASVAKVEGVRAVKVEENDTMNDGTASGGLPPKSFRVTVHGGDDDAVAQAIFDAKPAGIRAYGDVVGTAYDQDGNAYTIHFARPTVVPIYVDVSITSDGSAISTQDVKDAVKAYVNGLGIGDDVIYAKVVAAVMNIPGVVDATVYIDTTSPPAGQNNIAIGDAEVAETDDDKITVTVS